MSQTVKPEMIISWDTTLKSVLVQGKGFLEGQTYRDGMNKGLALLKEKRASRWLADMLSQAVMSIGDQDWTVQDWTPRAVNDGIRHTAFVVPKSTLGQMSLKRIVGKVGDKELTMAYFDNVEEARQWLRASPGK